MSETPEGGPVRRRWPLRLGRKRSRSARIVCNLVTFLVTGLAVAAALLVFTTLPKLDRDAIYDLPESDYTITILDAAGEEIGTRGQRFEKSVPLAEMPDHLIKAVLIAEDRRFFEHDGFDVRGILRALLVNLYTGETLQGGSTITQQLAKNLYLTPDRSAWRKLQEALIALWLETHLSKDEILTLYLNRIYMGAGTYGVEAASQYYFGKSVRSVNLAEAAMLAGLPKAPSRFSPTNDKVQARARADLILRQMSEAGVLLAGEAFAARAQPAQLVERKQRDGAQYFADWIASRVPALIEGKQRKVIVRTTLDPKRQAIAEAAISNALTRNGRRLNASQGALVSIEPGGAIVAMVGGRDYLESQFNRATQARRQPGSAFKPFVYLAAMRAGMKPDTVVEDEPIFVDGWQPRNFNGKYLGPVTLMEAFRESVNTVAVAVCEQIGRDRVIEVAHALGIHSPLAPNGSLPLGTSEVSLVELTAAYAPFSNGGERVAPYGIVKITNDDGRVLFEHEDHRQEVLTADEVETMTLLMHQVITEGTGQRANLSDRPAAGKTGTSQDFRDAWFVGYTGNQVTGVWFGNDDATPMHRASGGTLAAEAWRDYMVAAHRGLKVIAMAGARAAPEARDNQEIAHYFDRLGKLFANVEATEEQSGWLSRAGSFIRRQF